MKKPPLKYVGSKAVRALLDRYACPVPFHVVRMRFLGNIATPKLDASPIKTIESLWGGEMPVFDNVEAVNELFETMMNLWNELTKHQSGSQTGPIGEDGRQDGPGGSSPLLPNAH